MTISGKSQRSVRFIIFDLSEVLIAGLVGVEDKLSVEVPTQRNLILPCFANNSRDELFRGRITEDDYLLEIIECNRWSISPEKLKRILRENFHKHIDGMQPLLKDLSSSHSLVLLSDHAREWVVYIKTIHPFLTAFDHLFFSFEYQKLKSEPETFSIVLGRLNTAPYECVFIDDNAINIGVARLMNIPSIQFFDSKQLIAELIKKGIQLPSG